MNYWGTSWACGENKMYWDRICVVLEGQRGLDGLKGLLPNLVNADLSDDNYD